MRRLLFLFILLFIFFNASAQVITTFAGTGSSGYSGDGGPATAAGLFTPYSTISDDAGNLYIVDGLDHRIRKVNTSGVISTIAGTGSAGYSGDGGPATAAQLNSPFGIAIDAAGNLYVSDQNNDRIRKIDRSGIIRTIAGNGSSGYSGDGGPATSAKLWHPFGVAVDNVGRLFIADRDNNRIRRVDTSGTITTLAGGSTSGYGGDGGSATAAFLNHPIGVAVDRFGTVFVADYGNHCVRAIYTYGLIYTVAGDGTAGYAGDGGSATSSRLHSPVGLAVSDSGIIYIADNNNHCIRKISTSGIITTFVGNGSPGFSGDGGPASAAQLHSPDDVSIDGEGNAYITDVLNHVVRKVLLNHAPIFTGGHHQTMSVCEDATASINSLLSAVDSEAGQLQTWGVVSSPPHGYLSASYTATSTGSAITPSGLTYRPLSAYSGYDTFSVRVSDGYRADTTTVIVTVIPSPLGGYIRGADSTCPGAYDTLDNPTATPGGTWSHTDTFLTIADVTSGIVFGRAPGTENVIYSVTTVCGTATATLPVTVNTNPFSGAIIGPDSVCIGASISLTNPTATPGGYWTSSDTSVATVNSTGIVTGIRGGRTYIYYNAHTYCGSAPALHPVDVKPYAGIITGRDSVCLGDTVSLSETVYTGTWSSSAPAIATVASWGVVIARGLGTATITYTVASGTCGTAFVTHPLHISTVPSTPAITGATAICRATSTTLSGGPGGGLWVSNDTSIATAAAYTGIISGIDPGTAAISYTVTNNCGTATATTAFTVNTLPVVSPITGADSVCVGATTTAASATASGSWSLSNSHATLLSGTSATRIVSGISAGIDTLTYTVTNSCGAVSQSKSVLVLPAPNAGTITGATSVCQGASIALSSSSAGGSWSVSNSRAAISASGVVTGISAGVDTIFYAVTNSCGTATARHIVAISPLPAVAAIAGGSVVCPGSSITLTNTTSGGVWAASNGRATVNTTGLVTGVSLGADTISYSLTNSCGTSSAIKIVTVNSLVTPSITSTVSMDSIVCSGEGVTFTATTVNGGSAPYLRWMISGIPAGTGATYAYTPTNGDAVKCVLVSSDICALHDTFSSNTITMTVNPSVTPVTIITASPNDTVAFVGQNITFTTGLINCGSSPIFQWFVNGSPVAGATSATYSRNIFSNDTVFCIVSCNLACVATTYNHSNTIVVCAIPLAINDAAVTFSDLSLYPNPNSREFYLDGRISTQAGDAISMQILDMPGKVLFTGPVTPQNRIIHQAVRLDETIPPGMYLLKLATTNGIKILRFVVSD